MALFGTGYDPTDPGDNTQVSLGASKIRSLKQLLLDFLGVSFNLETGAIKPAAIPNPVPTPFGTAGTILTSNGASTQPSWQASPAVPVGAIALWATASPPSGYLICDGSTKLIATYPALAGVLGTTFGGDGSATFGLPDFRGRVPAGVGTGDASDATAWALAQKKGTEGHTLITAELPAHAHTMTGWKAFSGQHQNGSQGAGVYPVVTGTGDTNTASAGGDTAHTNLQPSIGLNFIIKT